jgi:lysophospholipase L1-like esterase
MAWCTANDVLLIRELDYHLTTADYRDGIHLSAAGQRRVADIMEEWIGTLSL